MFTLRKPINAVCWQNAELIFKTGGTYNCHWAFNHLKTTFVLIISKNSVHT
jgi:hypothetical protein